MEIEVRTTHLRKSSWALERVAQFEKKISRFEKIQFKLIKDEKKLIPEKKSGERIVLCDERGQSFTSRELAAEVEGWREGGIQRLVFLIGGPFGFSEEERKKVDIVLTLSSLVMNQEIALIVLMEQIFRSYTIINNHPYHND